MATLKGPGPSLRFDGSPLRIAIVHARWNTPIIEALLSGIHSALAASGVHPSNIHTTSVPGSYELPFAVQRVYSASQIQSSTAGAAGGISGGAAGDLLDLSSASISDLKPEQKEQESERKGAFDAIIAVGVLIKGETMHFEYIAEAVTQGLMRVQLDTGCPVIFGLLTVLNEGQAEARAGMKGEGHNHGEDWGGAAVELGVKRRGWGEGVLL